VNIILYLVHLWRDPFWSERLRAENADLRQQVEKLQLEGRVWMKQRSILVSNMSALLKTARAELDRRAKEIRELRGPFLADK
jgi:hypothetical protein